MTYSNAAQHLAKLMDRGDLSTDEKLSIGTAVELLRRQSLNDPLEPGREFAYSFLTSDPQ